LTAAYTASYSPRHPSTGKGSPRARSPSDRSGFHGGSQGIGLGGSFSAQAPPSALFLYLNAAPRTTGTVTNDFGTLSGSASGNHVHLVTGFNYVSTVGAFETTTGLAELDLVFVPEADTGLLLGAGLARIGVRRRMRRAD
jgi:hypothetical protein